MKRDSVSVYVHMIRDIAPALPVRICTHSRWPYPSLQQLRTYLTDGPFLNQKT